ncbi:CinA family protein [Flavobacterium sp. UMI-01]|uniref:CinA family protein n=1 Tax=Flavobacterium sp. UMI-01 TaxID=1441053 RepID=UPI001C7D894F|nr:CinA family protein [Flavobacterium sp. UMI-01]GIZ09011.1 damage-inducible protein CinA [Flavobacterium sp. UMI-01]
MASKQVIDCANILIKKKWKIAFVESVSAGKMAFEFSTVQRSGEILLGGIVCYDVCMKLNLLQIPKDLIETFTPESAEVTQAMAVNFYSLGLTDICVAVTGLATPGGSENSEKPVGTIFIHIIFPHRHIARRIEFKGTQEQIIKETIDETACIITEVLIDQEKNNVSRTSNSHE